MLLVGALTTTLCRGDQLSLRIDTWNRVWLGRTGVKMGLKGKKGIGGSMSTETLGSQIMRKSCEHISFYFTV